MKFLWPGFLLLLGLIPLITGIYFWMLRRRRRFAVRFSSLTLVREALPKNSFVRRHLPFVLFLLALSSLTLAVSRPVKSVEVPMAHTTIILAIDVSRSMCFTDILPSRLKVAKDAALSFIDRQDNHIPIGIVAFAGFAAIVQSPTTDQEVLQESIDKLSPARRTAIGSGILKSLDAISEVDPSVAPSLTGASAASTPAPLPKGTYAPAIIILLTDGASNTGPEPTEAAQQAADRGVRVYTIGFGTASGSSSMSGCSQGSEQNNFPQINEGQSGQTFGGGFGFRRGIDEVTLKKVADMTGGQYYSAESAHELDKVFQELPISYVFRKEETEIGFAFTALAALLASLAIGLSLFWHSLP